MVTAFVRCDRCFLVRLSFRRLFAFGSVGSVCSRVMQAAAPVGKYEDAKRAAAERRKRMAGPTAVAVHAEERLVAGLATVTAVRLSQADDAPDGAERRRRRRRRDGGKKTGRPTLGMTGDDNDDDDDDDDDADDDEVSTRSRDLFVL